MNISVLGCGRWGSCIAWYLDKIGHNVLSCGLADAPEFIQLKETYKNDYLTFPKSIEVSSNLHRSICVRILQIFQSTILTARQLSSA